MAGTATPNVLVVDDSSTMRGFVGDILRKAGYRAVLAGGAEDAMLALDRERIDLVVADVMMPGIDGYELCRRVKDVSADLPIPVLLLTAKADLESKVSGFEAGADDFLGKPFRPEELLLRVRVQLRLRVLQEQLQERNRDLSLAREQLQGRVGELEAAYREIAAHRDRTRRALELASRVQRALLPRTAPDHEGLRIGFLYEPAEVVAGDFFDFLELPGERLGVAIGDVAGKGAGASLLMVLAMSALRQAAEGGDPPASVLSRVNEIIRRQYDAGEMITLFYGILDRPRGLLTYASAGHEPGLLAMANGRVRRLAAGGPFLGIFPRIVISEEEVVLAKGDRLLLMTDGVLDRFARDGSEAAVQELSRILSEEAASLDHVWRSLRPGRSGAEHEPDDTTAIVLEVGRGRSGAHLGRIRFEASPACFREARGASQGVVDRLGLDSDRGFPLLYAVDEAVAHLIQEAAGSEQAAAFVEIGYTRTQDGAIGVEIASDELRVAPPQPSPGPGQDLAGMGERADWSLFLLEHLVRDFSLEPRGERGCRIRFEVGVPEPRNPG